ncbi:MAG: amidophosphoribosyltransferase [Deltaproteobacteria bacterium]|nr:MAG: amidophosphoribosyltransferase [Pseudomonadota bacterium]PIE66132.1 MAG: amidophosphoribosyltransferase [Deltaproteobacteria bacterium]
MCGIFGIYGYSEASRIAYLGLHALQHRGQESAGITASDTARLRTWRGMGLVVDVFNEETLDRLSGRHAIGHVRYSTAGESDPANAAPIAVRHGRGQLAVAHNGNLANAQKLRRELEDDGSIFTSNVDSEVVVHLYARRKEHRVIDRFKKVLEQLTGAYSLVMLTEKKLVAARDPHGFRPLELGRLRRKDGTEAWVFASETSAFDLIGATFERHVQPGEILVVDREGLETYPMNPAERPDRRFCVFEDIYFARPDSLLGERSVYENRERLGARLAAEHPVEAEIVIPVPDSGNTAALGYSRASEIPFGIGLVRSHYVGRTFIEPQQTIRHFGVKLKLAPVRYLIENKRVVVVDDSLVRGTTSRKIVEMLRAAGAAEVHLRISAPPTRHPCFYGIDMPSYEELIANNKSLEEIAAHVDADTIGYLSVEGMLQALEDPEGGAFCHACFSGNYPVPYEAPQTVKPLPLLQPPTRP